MPDEPLRLTLEEATNDEKADGWTLSYGFLRQLADSDAVREWRISEELVEAVLLAATALGQPVVARDDTAELRAAIKEWVDATDAEGAAHHDHGEGHITTDEYMAAFERYDSARSNLRRLAREAQ